MLYFTAIEFALSIIHRSDPRVVRYDTTQHEEEIMKKLAIWTVLSVFALSLAACAATSASEASRVKCPSCGYEFEVHVGE